jgi:outer membrane protein OmpA-like peptidoglycan-associated protein
MKKVYLTLISVVFAGAAFFAQGQTAKDSWSVGGGFSYPRFQSTDVRPLDDNYGFYLSLQRNFTENVALRLSGKYAHIKGRVPSYVPYDPLNPSTTNRFYQGNNGPGVTAQFAEDNPMHTVMVNANLDLLYYLAPCGTVSPYFFLGTGFASFRPVWGNIVPERDLKRKNVMQIDFGFGSEWKISGDWKLKTELGYNTIDGQLDGITNNTRQGIWGSDADAYITAEVGVQYYFSKGEPSKYCDLYDGIKVDVSGLNFVTKEQVEEIVKRYIPKEVVKEVVVEKPVYRDAPKEVAAQENWALYGVNFETNKSNVLPEGYPILEHAVTVLKENSDIKVEIQGHTDNVGTDVYNQKLSERRAESVKDYLVKKGIDAGRISTVGFGETKPLGDNSTIDGKAKNRRIEFKVLGK